MQFNLSYKLSYLRCDFEHGLCSWSNLKDDDFDFSRAQGRTDSTGTGPKYDHTTLTTSGIINLVYFTCHPCYNIPSSKLFGRLS